MAHRKPHCRSLHPELTVVGLILCRNNLSAASFDLPGRSFNPPCRAAKEARILAETTAPMLEWRCPRPNRAPFGSSRVRMDGAPTLRAGCLRATGRVPHAVHELSRFEGVPTVSRAQYLD